jgi:hypothetical protein
VRQTPLGGSADAVAAETMRLRRDLLNGQRALVQLSDANAGLRARCQDTLATAEALALELQVRDS